MGRIAPAFSNFTQGELSPKLEGNITWQGYFSGAKAIRNMTATVQGNVEKRLGTKWLAAAKYPLEAPRLIEFEHSDNDTYMLEFGDGYIRFYTDGGVLYSTTVSGVEVPYEIESPYSTSQVADLKFVNSADTTYIVHPSVPVQKLIRTTPTDWDISTVSFDSPAFLDENITTGTIAASATTGYVGLTASEAGTFNILHVGSSWRISGPNTLGDNIDADGEYVGPIATDNLDELTYTIGGTWVGTITLQRSYDQGITWVDVLNYTANVALQVTNYRDDVYWRLGFNTGGRTSGSADVTIAKVGSFGYVYVTDYIDSTLVSGTVQRDLPSTNATTKWNEGAWSEANGYPETVSFYEQRLIFGGTTNNPQTVWGSKVDSYEDFETGLTDDDSWFYQLASTNINRIKWLLPGEILYIGTLGAEWKFGNRTIPTTPSYVDAKRQTTWGSDPIQALIAGNMVFFVQRGGTILRTMVYDYRNENWSSFDLSKKSEHLFIDGIKTIAYTTRPDAMLWMVTNTGDMITCSLQVNIDNPIYAFQKYTTQGCYVDVATISGDDRDEVWVVVKRLVNGVSVHYIEQFQSALWSDTISITLPDTVLPVTFDPAPGTYYSGRWITMSCGTYGARIYYTTNGNIPTETSVRYTTPIYLDVTTTIKARAFI